MVAPTGLQYILTLLTFEIEVLGTKPSIQKPKQPQRYLVVHSDLHVG